MSPPLRLTLPTTEEGSHDGLRTLYARTDEELHEALLLFRVGRADEQLASSGITHLVEHLAFAPTAARGAACNGWVSDTTTGFAVRGTDDEVRAFVADTCRALAAPPTERLEHEQRIIETEESSQGTFAPWQALPMRVGARTWGTLGYEQLGLHRLGGEDVRAWAQARFTRENAVLYQAGPTSLDLRAEALPHGFATAWPTWQSVVGLATPTFASVTSRHVMLSMDAPTAVALGTTLRLLRTQAEQHLRHELGLSYAISSFQTRDHRGRALCFLWADCLPDHAEAVGAGLWRVLRRVADDGPAVADLQYELAQNQRAAADLTARSVLGHLAEERLAGREARAVYDDIEATLTVTADDVAASARDLADSVLVTSASSMPPDTEAFSRYPYTEPLALPGRKLRSRGATHDADLLLGEQGIALRFASGAGVNACFADVEAVLRCRNGDLGVLTANGDRITMPARSYPDVAQVAAALESAVDRDRFVELPYDASLVDAAPDLRPAGLGARLAAGLIDAVLLGAQFFVAVVLMMVLGALVGWDIQGAEEGPLTAAAYGLWAVFAWLYFALFEVLRGGTPGKLALSLAVVDDEGGRLSFGRASARFVVAAVGLCLAFVGFLSIPFSRRRHGLHDLATRSEVVRR